jgi:penicillin-binding protein 1A
VWCRLLEALRRGLDWLGARRSRRVGLHALTAAAVTLAMITVPLLSYVYADREHLPDLEPFLRFEPPGIGRIEDDAGTPLIELAREYRRVVTCRELPPLVRRAILAAEDKRFYLHSGVDYRALPRVVAKAMVSSVLGTVHASERSGKLSVVVNLPQGGSTVTQQLVRNYFLSEMLRHESEGALLRDTAALRLLSTVTGVRNANKLLRKMEEIRLSLWLERELTRRFGSRQRAKDEILARYASFVYLGSGRYGMAAASEYYFGKPLASYTDDDADKAAMLAGIPKSPADYSPLPGRLERPRQRRDRVLALMAGRGDLTPEAAERLQQRPLSLAPRSAKTEAPAAVDHVLEELKQHDGGRLSLDQLFDGRLQVRSTVKAPLQALVNGALENALQAFEARHPEAAGRVQGAVVVLRNRDAAVLAEAGGRRVYVQRLAQYFDLNRVLDARRQPGSAMKPVVYLAALLAGTALDSPVPDEPISVPMGRNAAPKWIANYDRKFKGVIPLRLALAESRNAPTIWLAKQVGVPRILETARTLGIRTPLAPYISTALGASDVGLLELANAYRALASGIVAEPHVIDAVTDASGSVVLRGAKPTSPLPVPAPVLLRIQEALRGVVRMPSGTAHALDAAAFPVPVMGKTGTTNNFRDALFVGSTYGADGITVAVRIGYDDARCLGDKETGGRAALPVFREVVGQAYARRLLGPVPRFPPEIERDIDGYLSASLGAKEAPPATGEPTPPASPTVIGSTTGAPAAGVAAAPTAVVDTRTQ